MESPANAPLWESFNPTLLFVSPQQQRTYGGTLPHRLLTPGVAAIFRPVADAASSPEEGDGGEAAPVTRIPPHAVVIASLITLVKL